MSVSARRSTQYRPKTPLIKNLCSRWISGKRPSSVRVVSVGYPMAAHLPSGRKVMDMNTAIVALTHGPKNDDPSERSAKQQSLNRRT